MSAKYFIDTNVFVYSFDPRNPLKRQRAAELIQDALGNGLGIISTQVIQEFLNVATRKFAVPMAIDDAREYLRLVLNPLCQVYPDLTLYEKSLELQAESGYGFYDSLILAGAQQGGCELLFSEDLQDGREIQGVKIINPFRVDTT